VRIGIKLWLINGMAIAALLGVTFFLLRGQQQVMRADRERATRYAVETAAGLVESLGKAAAKGSLTREQAQQRAIEQLRGMRYGSGEYFWINDLTPRMVMHPAKPELEGQELGGLKDPHGKALFQEMVKVVRAAGAGFVDYDWPRPGSQQPVPKISYVKGYEPWGWIIGSGVYVDDIDAAVAANARQYGEVVAVVALAMSLAAGLLAYGIARRVRLASTLATAVAQGDYEMRIVPRGRDEIAGLMRSLDAMQARLRERLEDDRRITRELARIKCALDHANMCVRVADNEGTVVYVNHALRDTLRRDERAFQRENPAFVAERVVGGSVGVFYADPQAAIERLRTLKTTTRSRMVLGGRTYDVVTTPIVTDDGERLGSVGQWLDQTEQLKAEEEIAAIVQAAVRGDFTGRIGIEGKEGFFLQLARSMNALMQISEAGLNDIVRLLSAMARADLSESMTGEYQGTFRRLQDDANKTLAQLTGIIGQIQAAAKAVDTAARDMAADNADLSQRTEEQAASLEQIAASMEQLTATVKLTAGNAQRANRMATDASDRAGDSGRMVQQLVLTMGSISESSQKIAEIISVIDDIAFQINILALNAAVEAARSGEHGRGFAVVASEVRKLANRSAVAAREIRGLIGEAADKVGAGRTLVQDAKEAMESTVGQVQQVTQVMAEISTAAAEQSDGIAQVNTAITQMEAVTRQNASLVEHAASTAESMEQQASELAALMVRFRLAGAPREPVADAALAA